MKKILNKLQDVYLLADKRVKEAEKETIIGKNKNIELDDRLSKVALKEEDLKVRASKIENVESVVELKNKNEVARKDISDKRTQLSKDREAHSELVRKELADIASRKANLESNIKTFNEEKEKVKQDLSNQILKELTAKLKK